ncbi:calcium-binding protein [Bacillus pseudomycoides]|uniref:Calcium-binding protein n=1 Tax=Bacillus pseudomycoides TaxID=64104 RepID=A0AA91V7Y9_9BACI|nr:MULTISPECIES: excalibur calcium-binding domain-containing protein [Bacillus]PEB56068.1 calcium-binding protein [Bacillus sp. AFS098217]PED80278.1 calcium-binding protein [Bacillus pseudomycoides]PEU12637.1 calcium-binding protein [Bacillus sp. AFS014408]PEU18001.1 calcium-binding protein [Bacillus sp. AFS019443]PFW61582.1 calcium-binding protein [Bacillus sp. AFS075034]
MVFWSNISTFLFLIALILLILCIISFFKKNGKAMRYGRPAVICFIISFLITATSTTETNHPIIGFFANLCLILFFCFLILAILSIIKKTGMAKKQFLITVVLFVAFGALSSIATPSTEKAAAKDKKIAAEKEDKKEVEKKEAEEKAQKQQEEQKRQAEEQTQKQQEEQKRQAEEQSQKQQEEQKRQAEEQARKQQEEQKRQAEEQARKQQEEQKRQAEEQAQKQQEEQKRQAEEQARKQQEQHTASQTQPAAENNSNVQYKNCTEVKNAGKAPLYSGQPGYSRKLDRDGDGVACER